MICRHQLREILQLDGQIEVVGEGGRGEEALVLLERHKPDLLVVDLVMPGQGGQETITLVMARHPLPILVLTAQPEGVRQVAVFDAIRRGALDLAEKPRRGDRAAEECLRRSIVMLAQVPVVRHVAGNQRAGLGAKPGTGSVATSARERQPSLGDQTGSFSTVDASLALDPDWSAAASPSDSDGALIVGIGASAGGPTPLATLLGGLPKDFSAAVAVVQHLPVGFMDAFVEYLRSRILLPVRKVEGRESLRPGVVYLPRDDCHLTAVSGGNIAVASSPPVEGHRPSVDVLFESLAKIHGRRSVGVILSGIGQDGVRGLLAMRNQGALTLAQSEATCAVFGMPQAALNSGAARQVMSPEAMAIELQRHACAQSLWRLAR